MSIADNAFNETLKRESERLRKSEPMIIAVMQISCGRDRKFLTVRENEHGELSYSMRGAGGGTSFSLNNLQVKQPLPLWRDEPVDVCLQDIGRIVEEGVYRVHSIEKPPSRPAPAPTIDPWGDYADFPWGDWVAEVENNDTRLGYADWVKAGRASEEM